MFISLVIYSILIFKKEYIFYFMEYINGGNLRYYLKIYKLFSQNTVRIYSAQLISAMLYLHQNGIIHRYFIYYLI